MAGICIGKMVRILPCVKPVAQHHAMWSFLMSKTLLVQMEIHWLVMMTKSEEDQQVITLAVVTQIGLGQEQVKTKSNQIQ
jgi:hypothetical protein